MGCTYPDACNYNEPPMWMMAIVILVLVLFQDALMKVPTITMQRQPMTMAAALR